MGIRLDSCDLSSAVSEEPAEVTQTLENTAFRAFCTDTRASFNSELCANAGRNAATLRELVGRK